MIRFASLSLVFALALTVSGCGPSREAMLRSAPTSPAASSSFVAIDPVPRANLPRAPHPRVVALSGGGPDGAFGAGYMVGQLGRADYAPPDIITGVSIGALVGAMAFTGDSQRLERVFTGGALSGMGSDTDPLRGLILGSIDSGKRYAAAIAEALDDAAIDRVAAQYRRGRRFYVATTDLDTMTQVVWDMGAIAAQPAPGAKAFFRRVILASGSIPAVYPPVPLADGTGPARLHVDGGASAGFYVPELAPGRRLGAVLIVINGKLGSAKPLERYTLAATAQRGVSSLIRAETRDLLEIERLQAARSGNRLTLVSLPPSVPALMMQNFSAAELERRFELGRQMGAEAAR